VSVEAPDVGTSHLASAEASVTAHVRGKTFGQLCDAPSNAQAHRKVFTAFGNCIAGRVDNPMPRTVNGQARDGHQTIVRNRGGFLPRRIRLSLPCPPELSLSLACDTRATGPRASRLRDVDGAPRLLHGTARLPRRAFSLAHESSPLDVKRIRPARSLPTGSKRKTTRDFSVVRRGTSYYDWACCAAHLDRGRVTWPSRRKMAVSKTRRAPAVQSSRTFVRRLG